MSRRRVVVLASAVVLLAVGLLALLAVVSVTQTDYGRGKLRDYLVRTLASRVQGKLHIGRMGGSLLTGVTVDSLEIRGRDDSLFVATGPIRVTYDPRDLIDRRILVRHLEVTRPVVHMRKDSLQRWNWKLIFPSGPKGPPRADPAFGDYIVVDSLSVRGARFSLTLPWRPNDTLSRAQKDSAIEVNLARTDRAIRPSGSFYTRTYSWTNGRIDAGYVRLAHPDSVGRRFDIARLDVDEFDPPFALRNARGQVRLLGDSLWLDLPHFDLPGSTGRAVGKVWWGSDQPNRYDIHVVGDSVSLADVAWVYPTLPTTGGGRMELDIRNTPGDLNSLDYRISNMDVASTRSRLQGAMTFGVGGELLVVKDLDVRMQPLDFELIKQFNGKPFPYDWRGQLIGTVRGPGGPVNRFRVDDARIEFRDANVPGAVTRARARGELDILFPAFTTFRGLSVDVERFDLRTIRAVNPDFPPLGGIVSGTAILDSVWTDVRFRNADLTHRDGPGPATRMTGAGRVTLGDEFLSYDLALTAAPLSFTTLARSYPELPVRGEYAGPLRIQGTLADLLVTTELTGPGGTLAFDGELDAYEPGYALRGSGRVASLDLRTLLADTAFAPSDITGTFRADVTGDSLANLRGSVGIETERSLVEGVRLHPSRAQLAFADGRVRVDSLVLETDAATVRAAGAFGLAAGVRDSLGFTIAADSLGVLRQFLAAVPDSVGADSLTGVVRGSGAVVGSIETFDATATLEATDIFVRGSAARRALVELAASGLPDSVRGTARVRVDTAVVAGVSLAQLGAEVRADDRTSGEFSAFARTTAGPELRVAGSARVPGDTALVSLDRAILAMESSTWTLDRPSRIVVNPDGVSADTVRLTREGGGSLLVAGRAPVRDSISLVLAGTDVPLSDIGELTQAPTPYSGSVSFRATAAGTRAAPLLGFSADLAAGRFGDVRLDRVAARGEYAARRLRTGLELFNGDRQVLSAQATVPIDLAFEVEGSRLLEEPLTGLVRSEDVDFGVVETLTPSLRDASGRFVANLDIGGTVRRPVLTGGLRVDDATVRIMPLGGVVWRGINLNVALHGDSLTIERAVAQSGEQRGDSLWMDGAVSVEDYENPRFDVRLRSRNFHAVSRPRVAHLDITSDLQLQGSLEGATLTGGVTVDQGEIFIPELIEKRLIEIDPTDDDLYRVVDTTVFANRSLLPKAPPELVRNLTVSGVQIRMGESVWLRSAEANIQLGGAVAVTVSRSQRPGRTGEQLALDGTLTTNRGSYRLNLGLVQRTFTVEQGTIRFFNDPDLNPTLDINAVHTVRQFGGRSGPRPDVRILVSITGTLAQPTLTLASADSLTRLSQSDLISYLVTGAPSFEVGGGYQATATRTLVSSLNSYVSGWLTGGLFDEVQFQAGLPGETRVGGSQNAFENFLAGTRLGLGKQLGDRTFVSTNAGLCGVTDLLGAGASTVTLWETLGLKVEHRLNGGFGVEFGIEPETAALLCGAPGGARSLLANTPRQLSFDLFKTWRF